MIHLVNVTITLILFLESLVPEPPGVSGMVLVSLIAPMSGKAAKERA
jgi:hypothetical protein